MGADSFAYTVYPGVATMRQLAIIGICAGVALSAEAAWLEPVDDLRRLFARVSEQSDESVLLLPDFVSRDAQGNYLLPLRLWVFEPERWSAKRRLLRRAIAKQLELKKGSSEYHNFHRRAAWFLVDNERGERVRLTIGKQRVKLPKSGADGHISRQLTLSAEQIAPALSKGAVRVTIELDGQRYRRKLPLAPEGDLMVISDIDDTLKVTKVLRHAEMLRNTFLRPFRAVDDLAAVYARWNRRPLQFHYVSASPWNLYPELRLFLQEHGFPAGVLHLRKLRLRPSHLHRFFKGGRGHKRQTIAAIMKRFVNKRVVLVGDSSEHDPELYAEIAKAYPCRILRVYIRRVAGADNSASRFETAFGEFVDWQLFDDSDELAQTLS